MLFDERIFSIQYNSQSILNKQFDCNLYKLFDHQALFHLCIYDTRRNSNYNTNILINNSFYIPLLHDQIQEVGGNTNNFKYLVHNKHSFVINTVYIYQAPNQNSHAQQDNDCKHLNYNCKHGNQEYYIFNKSKQTLIHIMVCIDHKCFDLYHNNGMSQHYR